MIERLKSTRPSTRAWVLLVLGVASYDVLCPKNETMSERFDDWLESPVSRTLAIGLTAITAAHLTNTFEALGIPNADPFSRALRWKDRPDSLE